MKMPKAIFMTPAKKSFSSSMTLPDQASVSAQYEMSGPIVQVQSSQIWPSIAVENWRCAKVR